MSIPQIMILFGEIKIFSLLPITFFLLIYIVLYSFITILSKTYFLLTLELKMKNALFTLVQRVQSYHIISKKYIPLK